LLENNVFKIKSFYQAKFLFSGNAKYPDHSNIKLFTEFSKSLAMSTLNNISATWRFYYLSGDEQANFFACGREFKSAALS
jgi:hypothetical protein